MKILHYLFWFASLLFIHSCGKANIEYQSDLFEGKYSVIDLCNEITIDLPVELGFTNLDVKFRKECTYTSKDNNDILLMIYQSQDTLDNSINEFVEKQQISNRAIYGNIVFSDLETNFFQRKMTFSYSAESAIGEENSYFFMKTFYFIIDTNKRTYLTFHFVTNSSHEVKDVLLKKANKLLNSFKYETRSSSSPTDN